jgi:hypothetical protein
MSKAAHSSQKHHSLNRDPLRLSELFTSCPRAWALHSPEGGSSPPSPYTTLAIPISGETVAKTSNAVLSTQNITQQKQYIKTSGIITSCPKEWALHSPGGGSPIRSPCTSSRSPYQGALERCDAGLKKRVPLSERRRRELREPPGCACLCGESLQQSTEKGFSNF